MPRLIPLLVSKPFVVTEAASLPVSGLLGLTILLAHVSCSRGSGGAFVAGFFGVALGLGAAVPFV
jgi:hypothetical protein